MTEAGIDFIKTREPGGSPISEKVRNIVLGIGNEEMDPKTEVLLIAGARRQHVVETIRPALAAGKQYCVTVSWIALLRIKVPDVT